MSLKLYASNKLEELAEIFRQKIYDQPGENIFVPIQAVVQTGGIELFLRKYLAAHANIAANLETPFLNRFINNIMEIMLPETEYKLFRHSAEQFSPEVLKWRIFDELQNNPSVYPEAEKYAKDPNCRYQLSKQLAETFDRYIWYHPEMLLKWRLFPEAPGHWEKRLYLALIDRCGNSPDSFFARFFSGASPVIVGRLRKNYALFGIGAMPQLLLEFCKKLGEYTNIHLFYLNPCREYWGGMRSDMELRRDSRKNGSPEPELQIDNPLLANLGTWGREFFENSVDLMVDGEEGCFIPPSHPEKSMLHRVQLDILNSVNGTYSEDFIKDRSISVHNCHSKRREVEVLQDQLLLAIKELNIRPDDIIVMAPDINAYAPFIEAVFSAGKLAHCYNISDRSLVSISSTAENLSRIIALYSARCTVEEILAIFDAPPVRENFGLDDNALTTIKNFIKKSRICWGENAAARQEFCQTAFDEFSWQDGLDRLLLGYAAQQTGEEELDTPWAPAGNVYGDEAELLGTVCQTVGHIFRWRHFCKEEHAVPVWAAFLEEILDTMYGRAYTFRRECEFLKRCISDWRKKAASAGFTRELPVKVLIGEMNSFIGGLNDKNGYLSGGITFCSLVPMRSIPAKVIAVLGLSSLDFPRQDPHNGLNISNARKKGERSRLLEDRYLFLETLLAARERLLLFYPGQGTNPKVSCSPAAPLENLINYLEKCFSFAETKHFRHAHDAGYFSSGDPNCFSFSEHHCRIARNIQSPPEEPSGDDEPASLPEEVPGDSISNDTPAEYSIDDLANILYNPLAAYLKYAAGVSRLKLKEYFAAESEPTGVDLPQEAIEDIIKDKDPADLAAQLSRQRELPPGECGNILFSHEYKRIRSILRDIRTQQFVLAERVIIDIKIGGKFRVTGLVSQVPETLNLAQVYKYPGALSRLNFYLSSLCSSYQTERCSTEEDTAVIGNEILTLPRVDKQTAHEKLLELILLAETAKTRLLPILPKASLKFAATGNLNDARNEFTGSFQHQGDIEKPFIRDFFTAGDFENEKFREEFQKLARIIHAPWCKS